MPPLPDLANPSEFAALAGISSARDATISAIRQQTENGFSRQLARLEFLILATPSGEKRNKLAEANILLLNALDVFRAAI